MTTTICIVSKFLSTLSLRRATFACAGRFKIVYYFYPRSPCGERQLLALLICPPRDFYPRSPCGERRILTISICTALKFLSTLSLRRATFLLRKITITVDISIHALLAESDNPPSITPTASRNFYPRSPCGERHLRVVDGSKSSIISIHALLAESDRFSVFNFLYLSFLSTLSLRRATVMPVSLQVIPLISIHALLAESDYHRILLQRSADYFYPRSPCGERRVTVLGIQHRVGISIHALLAESD